MLDTSTWDTIFWALSWTGVGIIILFYINPLLFESKTPNTMTHAPLFSVFFMYVGIWLFVLLLRYFDSIKKNAQIKGLWKMKPDYAASSEMYDKKTGKMIPVTGIIDLLSESDSKNFMAETFTFSCFISVNHSSIEGIKGDSLKHNFKPYQLVVSVPGVYDIYVDPFHETLLVEFKSYNASSYKTMIHNFKVNRWNQILISMEGRTADIYINGILIKSIGLQNVVKSKPGKPRINMNPEMYADVAFVQTWPQRLKEPDIIANYKWNTNVQGIPPLPIFFDQILTFPTCIGNNCTDSVVTSTNGISYVNYEYA
jgi:hypothetical protein